MNQRANPQSERILILDFGSQYTQLIGRSVRESGVYCEIHSCEMLFEDIVAFQPAGVILSGGPDTVTEENTHRAPADLFFWDRPILGICYGMQAITTQLGGDVETSSRREYGYTRIVPTQTPGLLADLSDSIDDKGQPILDVWMSHGDRVTRLPEGFVAMAGSDNTPFAAISDTERHYYGLQFHPEVTHTTQGREVLNRFVREICGCSGQWLPGSIIEDIVSRVRAEVGVGNVILGVSGGVDSSVAAALLHRAIGDQLTCIFVDNGLLRLHEGDEVMATFSKFGVKVNRVNAQDRFLEALEGVTDPEEKRKIIGRVFVDVFEEEATRGETADWLAQGTIYPDVIESAGAKSGKAKLIKSHHNVGGLPETLHLRLLEPLKELFKDEVRRIGVALELPSQLINRQPFPGPGLGVRILGEVKKEYADLLRHADAIYLEELRNNDLYDEISQAFAIFLPVRSVGIVGDTRAYEYVIVLRAVETVDFMTAKWKRIPYDILGHISTRIINEVRGISRVTYDISSKPPATIEWE